MVKKCELCKVRARAFCESDQASLCWTCDEKVHGANFLVARHSRTLLCGACDSLTPWKATGAALVNAVSVCDRCADAELHEQQQEEEDEEEEESEGGNDEETDTEDDDGDGDEDGDNQVVPWSASTPPPAASSSGSEESVNGDGDGSDPATTATSLKRRRDDDASDRDLQVCYVRGIVLDID